MKLVHWSLSLVLFLLMVSFSEEYKCGRSGIKGHVYLESGNRMPSPEDVAPAIPKGIKTTLYIYSLTNISEVKRDGVSAFYKSIATSLVKEVPTDENGYFKVKLNPGTYSLFVKKGDMFYSSQFDEKNNIHPVEVKPGKLTPATFKVNYNAVY